MSRLLPLFPLNLVVFPGEKLNLHIFEPRYRQLIADCAADGTTFGIPPYFSNAVHTVGTEVRLVKVERSYETGESDIRTQGLGRFRVQELLRQAPGKLYAAGYVTDAPDDPTDDPVLRQRITEFIEQLYDILGLRTLFLNMSPDFRVFDLAHHLGLSTEQEYELLALDTEQERQQLVVDHLLRTLPVLQEAERLKERVRLNGHFKHLLPPTF